MKKMLKNMYKVAAVLMLMPLVAGAAVILNETFSDGDRALGSDAQDTAWFATEKTSNTTIAIGTDSVFSGNVLSLTTTSTSTSINRRMIGEFAMQTLTNVGDWISVSVDFRMPVLPASITRAFKVGLMNTNGTSLTADLANSNEPTSTTKNAISDDKGYFISIGTGPNGTTALGREDGTGATFLGGTDIGWITPVSGTSPQLNDMAAHKLILKVTKDSATTVYVDLTYDGASSLSGGSGTTIYTAFNEVGFSTGSSGTGFIIDNVVVTTPEPATVALLSLGFFALRKRK